MSIPGRAGVATSSRTRVVGRMACRRYPRDLTAIALIKDHPQAPPSSGGQDRWEAGGRGGCCCRGVVRGHGRCVVIVPQSKLHHLKRPRRCNLGGGSRNEGFFVLPQRTSNTTLPGLASLERACRLPASHTMPRSPRRRAAEHECWAAVRGVCLCTHRGPAQLCSTHPDR